MKKVNARAHWEIARGTAQENMDYVRKDGEVFEMGESKHKGAHARKCSLVDAVMDIVDNNPGDRAMVEKHGSGYIQNKR